MLHSHWIHADLNKGHEVSSCPLFMLNSPSLRAGNTDSSSLKYPPNYRGFSPDVIAAREREKSLLGIWLYHAQHEPWFAVVLCTNVVDLSRDWKPPLLVKEANTVTAKPAPKEESQQPTHSNPYFEKDDLCRTLRNVRSRWAGACNSHSKPMSRHFYRLIHF